MDTDSEHFLLRPHPCAYVQLSYSYSANTRVTSPCHLHLTSWKGPMKAKGEAQITGMANWMVTRTEAGFVEHFEGRKDRCGSLGCGILGCGRLGCAAVRCSGLGSGWDADEWGLSPLAPAVSKCVAT